MSKKNFERQLAALEELRQGAEPAAALKGIRKALQDRNNFLVAKAAGIAAQLGLSALVPDMLTALDRFFVDPAKSDPQCWAKKALVKALAELGHDNSAPFVRGLRHAQMEPVWGGQEDTAGALRGNCALALIQCRDLSDFDVLSHLIEILVDSDKTVRVEAARAIGRMERPEAALLVRLRALAGDPDPEVLGACFSAVLSIEGRKGIGFVGRFLDQRGEAGAEAALAIGMLRTPEAFQVLKERWERESDAVFAALLLSAIALTNQPEALDYLVALIETDSPGAVAAGAALASMRMPPGLRTRVAAAVERNGNPRVRAAFARE